MDFYVGDRVTWTSQAGGSVKTKTGEIVRVIEPEETWGDMTPYTLAREQFGDSVRYMLDNYVTALSAGKPRYLVLVKKAGRQGKDRLYMPRVSALKLAE